MVVRYSWLLNSPSGILTCMRLICQGRERPRYYRWTTSSRTLDRTSSVGNDGGEKNSLKEQIWATEHFIERRILCTYTLWIRLHRHPGVVVFRIVPESITSRGWWLADVRIRNELREKSWEPPCQSRIRKPWPLSHPPLPEIYYRESTNTGNGMRKNEGVSIC